MKKIIKLFALPLVSLTTITSIFSLTSCSKIKNISAEFSEEQLPLTAHINENNKLFTFNEVNFDFTKPLLKIKFSVDITLINHFSLVFKDKNTNKVYLDISHSCDLLRNGELYEIWLKDNSPLCFNNQIDLCTTPVVWECKIDWLAPDNKLFVSKINLPIEFIDYFNNYSYEKQGETCGPTYKYASFFHNDPVTNQKELNNFINNFYKLNPNYNFINDLWTNDSSFKILAENTSLQIGGIQNKFANDYDSSVIANNTFLDKYYSDYISGNTEYNYQYISEFILKKMVTLYLKDSLLFYPKYAQFIENFSGMPFDNSKPASPNNFPTNITDVFNLYMTGSVYTTNCKILNNDEWVAASSQSFQQLGYCDANNIANKDCELIIFDRTSKKQYVFNNQQQLWSYNFNSNIVTLLFNGYVPNQNLNIPWDFTHVYESYIKPTNENKYIMYGNFSFYNTAKLWVDTF